MRRRSQLLRKASRRSWAPVCTLPKVPNTLWNQSIGPVSCSDPSFESKCQAAAQSFFSSLSSHRLEDFAVKLQTVLAPLLRTRLLMQFRDDVAAGLWGDPDRALPCAISLLKRSPNNPELRQIAEHLNTLKPLKDPNEVLVVSPEQLIWWEDITQLLPVSSAIPLSFHYSAHILTCIRRLRAAITAKTLPIGGFLQLKRLSPEQRRVLLQLLRLEHINEVEEALEMALAKALELLDLTLLQTQRIKELLQTRKAEIRGSTKQTAAAFFESFYSMPLLNCTIPAELKDLLELPEESVQVIWLDRLLPDISTAQVAFPLVIADLLDTAKPLYALPPKEQLAYFQRALLSLAFPQILMHIELSQESVEEKYRLMTAWQLSHSLQFPDYLREVCYETLGGLVAVFTRDLKDAQFHFEFDYTREKAADLSSEPELHSSLAAFLRNSTQTVYVLDYFLNAPQAVDLETAKRTLEEAAGQPSLSAKLICLLVRLPYDFPALPGTWQRCWKVASFESLSEPFSTSMEELQTWLKRDTLSWLVHSDFVRSQARVEAILAAAYPLGSEACRAEIQELARSEDFCELMGKRLGAEEGKWRDWKERVLNQPQETCLRDTVEKVLRAEAAAILSPLISTIKGLQAIPSFLSAPQDSLIRKLWHATFLQLLPFPVPPQADIHLQYPFVQLDYIALVASEDPPAFASASVTTLHVKIDPSAVSLMQLYLADIVALDLAAAPYAVQGKAIFERFCMGSKSFEELISQYCNCRRLILAICKCEKQAVLDRFFTNSSLLLLPSKEDLRRQLEECEAQLAFAKNPSICLYSVQDRTLHTFNSVHKRVSNTRLSDSLDVKAPSLISLDIHRLFVCGGQGTSWLRDSVSAESWIIALPDAVQVQGRMRIERCYHGLALCRGFVYAIGGHVGLKLLRTCEKFCIGSGKWQSLPQVLEAGRGRFTPLVYMEEIYILGGNSPLIEVIHPESDRLTTLSLSLPVTQASISLFLDEGKALVLSETQGCVVDLCFLQYSETAGTGMAMWSAYAPALLGGEVFFVDDKLNFKWWTMRN